MSITCTLISLVGRQIDAIWLLVYDSKGLILKYLLAVWCLSPLEDLTPQFERKADNPNVKIISHTTYVSSTPTHLAAKEVDHSREDARYGAPFPTLLAKVPVIFGLGWTGHFLNLSLVQFSGFPKHRGRVNTLGPAEQSRASDAIVEAASCTRLSCCLVSVLVSPCELCAALIPARIDFGNGRASGRNGDPGICCLGSGSAVPSRNRGSGGRVCEHIRRPPNPAFLAKSSSSLIHKPLSKRVQQFRSKLAVTASARRAESP